MTYVRRRPDLLSDQFQPAVSRALLWLTVNDVTVVNVCQQLFHDAALETLLRWPPPRCLVAGDFNVKHPMWQTGRLEGRGEAIAAWAAENRLALLNETDVPTNPHGNTIDLAFTNVDPAEATIEDHLTTSSDHYTLNISLPGMRRVPARPSGVRLTSDGEVERFVEVVKAAIAGISADASTPEQLDTLATNLVTMLQRAAQAAGYPIHKTTRSALWWMDECATAAGKYQTVRRRYLNDPQLHRPQLTRLIAERAQRLQCPRGPHVYRNRHAFQGLHRRYPPVLK
jgi:hypothetical protein